MKKTLTTAAIALALGLVWTAGPALAQSTGEKIKDKAADVKDTIKEKAEDVKDKAVETKDKISDKMHRKDKAARTEDKTESTMDKAKDKAVDTKDKIKDKTVELKDKAKAKMHHAGKADVSATQQALKDKGFDPGPVDGRMGPRTKTALMDFQRKEGLKPTGRLDNDTTARLGVGTAMTPSASPKTTATTPPAASPTIQSSAPAAQNNAGTTQPPATPEDKTAPPTKSQNP